MKTPTRFDPETARFVAREVFAKGRFERDDQEPSDSVSQAARAVDRMCDEAEKLLPCPFCAGVARGWVDSFPGPPTFGSAQVRCQECKAVVLASTYDEARAAWNSRTARPS